MMPGAILLAAALLTAAFAPDPPREPPPPRSARIEPPTIAAPPPQEVIDMPPPPPQWIQATRVPEFRKCAACHLVERGAPNGIGPNLYGVFGRPAATSQPDYRYSQPLRRSGLVWDYATLDRWLAGPRTHVPGTKMTFAGLRKAEERRAIIAFLRLRSAARP